MQRKYALDDASEKVGMCCKPDTEKRQSRLLGTAVQFSPGETSLS